MDLSGKGLTTLDQVPRFAQAVDLSYNKLQTLKCGATHSHKTQLHVVEELLVQHNRLSSLAGIGAFVSLKVLDCSFNSLRRIDVAAAGELAELAVLQSLDLSNNNIGELLMEKIALTPATTTASSSPPFSFLTRISLSHNVLTAIPNLTACAALQEVELDNNSIESLAEIHALLPPQITTLTLHDNQIASWQPLSELTVFADTLSNITFANNPFVHSTVRFSLKMFVAWLLPMAETINDEALTPQEQVVVERLFRHGPGQQFAEELLHLMDDGRERDLQRYLEQHCVLQPQQPQQQQHHGVDSLRTSSASSPGLRYPQAATQHHGAEDQPTVHSGNVVEVVASLSTKLRNVTEVVKVLRRQDMNRRVRAAIVIQKFIRGFQVRRGLPHSARHRLRAAHRAVLVARARGGSTAAPTQQPPPGAIDALQRELQTLTVVVQRTWNDIAQIKAFVHTQRVYAARRIQAFYRGYKARMRYRRVQAEYRRFASKFVPAVVRIQSVVRMFLQRKRFLVAVRKERELASLRSDVATLKQQMAEMMTLVRALQQPQPQPQPQRMWAPTDFQPVATAAVGGVASPAPRIASWAPTGSRHDRVIPPPEQSPAKNNTAANNNTSSQYEDDDFELDEDRTSNVSM